MTNSPIILYILGSAIWVQREGLYGNRGWFLGRLGGGGRVFKEGSWDDGRGGFLDAKEVALIKLSTF